MRRSKKNRRMSSLPGIAVYLVIVAGWLLYCGYHTFHVGQMPLLRSQAVAMGACFALGVSLASGWVLMVLRFVGQKLGWELEPGLLDRTWIRVALLALLALTVALVIYGRYVEPRRLVVRELAMGRQDGATPVRVAVISDLHVSGDHPPFTKLASTVNATRPDMIVLLGDTLNRRAALPTLHRVLSAMRAPHGKYAVWGNWEAWYWHDLPLLDGTGFRWLDATTQVSRTIRGITVHLTGLPYRDTRRDGREAERLLARLPGGGWRLFLYHTPDLAPGVPSAHLYLAGHTHGGQIALPLYGALVTLSRHGKRFERGRVQLGGTVVYTNPGIGVEPAIPIRLGVPPEVTLVLLGQRPSGPEDQ
jgi:predicted MPP superfamily phosphohydrolase